MKVVTLWVRPKGEAPLPEAQGLLEGLLSLFYEAFPEYEGTLAYSQSPRPPRYAFVYVNSSCRGLLPPAGCFLRGLLERAFPQGEVRAYGRVWPEGP
ncbi:hypothetical protein DV704_00280 [Meiothermus sp. QL-1]|nr:hypothetical protein [Meiothermus sp. QL-1]RDI96727.1 hypothetical protein DV704_00280 [Meiothermus sp. QL-1]